eukprot:5691722-Prymnesium_polylepis.1
MGGFGLSGICTLAPEAGDVARRRREAAYPGEVPAAEVPEKGKKKRSKDDADADAADANADAVTLMLTPRRRGRSARKTPRSPTQPTWGPRVVSPTRPPMKGKKTTRQK